MLHRAFFLSVCLLVQPAHAETLPAPRLLGEIVVPSGLSIAGVGFGGISDLAWDARTRSYLAISDDRAENGPARIYEVKVEPADGAATLDIAAMHELRDENGAPFAPKGIDGEGVAIDAASAKLFWSSARDREGRPAIYRSDLDMTNVERLELPSAYMPDAAKTKGVRDNLGFEGLTVSAGRLYAVTENALAQDGGKATLDAGSASRILVLDTKTLKPTAEYLYRTEPIPEKAKSEPFYNDNGVSAIATLPDGRFVVVERAFGSGVGNHIRFFLVDFDKADDMFGASRLDPAAVKPVAKTLWFELKEGDHDLDIDNIESLSFGPVVDGEQTMLVASDNNFTLHDQFTQFVLFAVPKF